MPRCRQWVHRGTLTTAALLLASLAATAEDAAPAAAAPVPTSPPASLTADQQALADRMQAFQDRMERELLDRIAGENGNAYVTVREFDYENASHRVKVARGPVVEKAGWYTSEQKKGMPPMVPDPLFSRYMEINVHPATPHVGMLHATIYFTYLKNGAAMLAGYMDYVPGVDHPDDNQRLKQAVDAVFTTHGQDITRFRKELCESAFGAKHHRDNLKAACVGVSLYAPPMLKITDANLDLVFDTFQAFTGEYFAVLDARKGQPATNEDRRAQNGMRKRWLEDQVFADTFSRKVVPYEVWSLANLPPTVRF